MKKRLSVWIMIMMTMTVQLAYGFESGSALERAVTNAIDVMDETHGVNQEVVIETAETDSPGEGQEITDPEVLDRMEKMASQYRGISQRPEEIQAMVEEAKSPNHMPVDVLINGSYLKSDVEAMIISGRTYVPLRALCEVYNIMDIEWSEAYYKASIMAQGREIMFLVNTNELVVDEELITMDSPTVIVDGRTMVPVRFISELLGFQVEWDEGYFTVSIRHDSFTVNPDRLDNRFYTYEEVQTFSKLVMKEAGSVSYETIHGVASVVMNRLRHAEFEDTINGVIFEENRYSTQFPPAHTTGFFETEPNASCVLAVKKVLRGENSVAGCIYFNTSPFNNTSIYKMVDGVYFCY